MPFPDGSLEPGLPKLARKQVALSLIEGGEARIEVRLEGPLLQKPCREGVERRDGRALRFAKRSLRKVGLFGPGLRVDVDPSGTNFNTASVVVRVLLMADVALRQPSAFVKSTSIT
jgi:hypothetical protein